MANNKIKLTNINHILLEVYKIFPILEIWLVSIKLPSQLLLVAKYKSLLISNILLLFIISFLFNEI
jgi:hypothetical protein